MARTKQTARCNKNVFRSYINVMSRGSNTFVNVPSSSTLTYDGLINENFFQLSSNRINRNNFLSVDYANCEVFNPLDRREREIWQGMVLTTRYDGVGLG